MILLDIADNGGCYKSDDTDMTVEKHHEISKKSWGLRAARKTCFFNESFFVSIKINTKSIIDTLKI